MRWSTRSSCRSPSSTRCARLGRHRRRRRRRNWKKRETGKSEHCSLCIVHCALFVVLCSLAIVHCSLLIAHCSLLIGGRTALHWSKAALAAVAALLRVRGLGPLHYCACASPPEPARARARRPVRTPGARATRGIQVAAYQLGTEVTHSGIALKSHFTRMNSPLYLWTLMSKDTAGRFPRFVNCAEMSHFLR